jgi:hypothetical protein
MMIFPITGAVIIVFFGYLALWSASQANTPGGISSFGKVLAIILFVMAGLVLIGGIARHGQFGRGHMMGGWDKQSMMSGCGPGNEKPWMMQGNEKGKPGMPPSGEKAGKPEQK